LPTSSDVDEILTLLRRQPYFSVRITPGRALEAGLSQVKCAVAECAISLRGWDFPHFESRAVYNAPSFAFSYVNWERHVEYWRMYQSGQFVFLGASWDTGASFQDVLMKEVPLMIARDSDKESVVGVLSFIGMIYSVTEFYLFASRLSTRLGYAGDARLDIALHNIEGWALGSGDPRISWHYLYQAHVGTIRAPVPESTDLLTSADAATAARSGLLKLFEGFDWDASSTVIEDWQQRLMQRRFM
jgi:hypothetical protein